MSETELKMRAIPKNSQNFQKFQARVRFSGRRRAGIRPIRQGPSVGMDFGNWAPLGMVPRGTLNHIRKSERRFPIPAAFVPIL